MWRNWIFIYKRSIGMAKANGSPIAGHDCRSRETVSLFIIIITVIIVIKYILLLFSGTRCVPIAMNGRHTYGAYRNWCAFQSRISILFFKMGRKKKELNRKVHITMWMWTLPSLTDWMQLLMFSTHTQNHIVNYSLRKYWWTALNFYMATWRFCWLLSVASMARGCMFFRP